MSMTVKCKISQKITNPRVLEILAARLGWINFRQNSAASCSVLIPGNRQHYYAHFDLLTGNVTCDGDYLHYVQPELDRINGIEYNASLAVHSLRSQGLDYTETRSAEGYPVFEAEIKEVSYA